MTKQQFKERYTRIEKLPGGHRISLRVGDQYFQVAFTDEGKKSAEWFQEMLVIAMGALVRDAVLKAFKDVK